MKRALASMLLLFGVLSILTQRVHAKQITVNFTATNFHQFVGSTVPPVDPVIGTIVYDADSTTSNIKSLISVELNIPGHTYTISNVGFASQWAGMSHMIGGLTSGIGGIFPNTDDFYLEWYQSTNMPRTFAFNVAGNTFFWTSNTFTRFSVSDANSSPVAAIAASIQSVPVNTVVFLDGTGSYDADGDPLTYHWTLLKRPANSSSAISDPTAKVASFIPDLPGTYDVQLVVDDGKGDSNPAALQLQAYATESAAIEAVSDIQAFVSSLTTSSNANNRKALQNKLNVVIADIDAGRVQDAITKMRNDIMGKADGCAANGTPDRNDWITSCEGQGELNYLCQKFLWLVEGLD